MSHPAIASDFLVLGSGIAGLRAAVGLARHGTVLVVTKDQPTESNTGYAQGGVAVALATDDTPELHLTDTLEAGAGIVSAAAARVLVEEGPERIRELAAWGARFDREGGRFHFTREGAHSRHRVLHALGDATGWEMVRALLEKARRTPAVEVRSFSCSSDLVMVDGRVVGCRFLTRDDRAGEETRVLARATLLATGGAGQVFRETTNPAIATGDGVAMAFKAGARVTDLEFVQFHPTVMNVAGAPRFLLSEALRGEGAWLVNAEGERFVHRYEPAGDLASRDLVSRAMVREAERTGAPVYLTMAHLDPAFVRARFPTIAQACRNAGLDLATDRIPVSPAAHYVMGGVETDLDGRTSIAGLFAAGEVACTGVHGANRLASNSLLEGLVFGARAAEAMARTPGDPATLHSECVASVEPPRGSEVVVPAASEVRDLMWKHVGLVRSRPGLEAGIARLSGWWTAIDRRSAAMHADLEIRRVASIVTVGFLIARAALRREESRGGHFRTDFPEHDDLHWKKHVSDRLGARGSGLGA